MRLIDADELKKKSYRTEFAIPVVDVEDIDNAPTVETTIEHFVDLNKIKTDCLNCEKFKRPQGKWTQFLRGHYSGVKCSECNTIMDFTSNYCPYCGAYMKE